MQEMTEATNRFTDVWADAAAAVTAAREQRTVERSYRHMLAMTDEVLGQLERCNLADQRDLDHVMRRNLARALDGMPSEARSRFPAAETVQEALDGVFEVQEELMLVLQRMVHWDRLLAGPWDGAVQDADEMLASRTA